MRVLILCEHYCPHVDACAKRMKSIVDVLQARNHDVVVLASETSLEEVDAKYEVPAHVHLYKTSAMTDKTVFNRLKNNSSQLVASYEAAKKLGPFDVVLVTSPPLMLAESGIRIARNKRAKLVFDVRDIWPDVAYEMGSFSPKSIYGRVFEALANRAYKKASLITTVTRAKVIKLKTQLPPGDAEKVQLVANGLDKSFLDLDERQEIVERYALGKHPTCVYIGNLGLAQGLVSLLRIAAIRKDVRFLIFGSGAEEKLLRETIAKWDLDGNVELCGRVDSQGVRTLLCHADCAYVSLKNSQMVDSVPTKLFEALGSGCPVLLAAKGESTEILKESGLGIACDPEDQEGLLSAFNEILNRVWSDEERLYAQDFVKAKYSREAASRKLELLLTELNDD